MSTTNRVYRYTVVELVRKGFNFRVAKKMVKTSTILDRIKGPGGWAFLHDWNEKDWADWVVKYHLEAGNIKFNDKEKVAS